MAGSLASLVARDAGTASRYAPPAVLNRTVQTHSTHPTPSPHRDRQRKCLRLSLFPPSRSRWKPWASTFSISTRGLSGLRVFKSASVANEVVNTWNRETQPPPVEPRRAGRPPPLVAHVRNSCVSRPFLLDLSLIALCRGAPWRYLMSASLSVVSAWVFKWTGERKVQKKRPTRRLNDKAK